jgi:hypothetical protein
VTKNPILLLAIGAVLVSFGFYHFGLGPKRKEAAAAKAKIATAQDKLDQARTLLASNEAARKGYQSEYATVVRLGKAVPGDDDVRSLVVQLDRAAKRTHVNFQSIDVGGGTAGALPSTTTGSASAPTQPLPPGVTVGPAGFPIMPFTFTFRGGFFRLGEFFHRLDDFVRTSNKHIDVTGRLLTVDGLKLEPDQSGFPNIKATVSATSYLVSPLEGATGGATPTSPTGGSAAGGTTPSVPNAPATPPTTTATLTGGIR